MRRPRLAGREPSELLFEAVVQRMILNLDVDAEPPGHVCEVLHGSHVLLEPCVRNARREQDRTTEQRRRVHTGAVRDFEHETERARRMPGNRHRSDFDTAEPERLAVTHDEIAFRRRQSGGGRRGVSGP